MMTSLRMRLCVVVGFIAFSVATQARVRSDYAYKTPPPNATLATCTWTGSTSTDWSDPGNWSNCNSSQPQAGDTVIVPTAANQPTITTTAPTTGAVSTITVNSGGKLTVATGGALNTNSGPVINAGGEIEVAGGTVTVSTGNLALNGKLTISSGTFNLATTTETDLVYATGSTITVASGALNIGGSLYGSTAADTTTYQQSGGTLTVAIFASTSPFGGHGAFDIRAAGSTFNMSAGSIVQSQPAANVRDVRIEAATSNVTGGTVQIADANTVGGSFYSINCTTPIFNLIISSGGGPTLSVRDSHLVVKGNVNIQSAATLRDIENQGLSVGGNWTNDGTFLQFAGSVTFNGSSNQTVGGANITTFNNLIINNPAGITLTQSALVANTLTLTTGNITTGGASLTINTNGSVSRTSGHVIGNLKKIYGGVGSFRFDVGTANGYSPLDTTVTAGSGDLTVTAIQGPQPDISPSTSLQRYWTLNGSGITADLVFHYLDPTDIAGTEANYRIIRVSGGTAVSFPNNCGSGSPCVDTTANTGTLNGVSNFSDWTVGEQAAPTAANGVVSGIITSNDGTPVAGAVVRLNGTQLRKTITDDNGAYRFDNVETNGFYTLTPSRSNYSFAPANRSFSQFGQHTEAVFTGTTLGDIANPLDTAEFFVRQQYLDLLGREPDEAGFNYWSDRILECGADVRCSSARRRAVAAAFFIEREFQQTGYFVYRLYRAALGTRPVVTQYLSDRNRLIAGVDLDLARQSLADDFIKRAAFVQAYPDSMTNEQFVNKLCDTAGIFADAIRAAEIGKLNNGGTRSQVLQDVIEEDGFKSAQYNAAFVTTEYFAYLRRNPEPAGFDFWLDTLNNRESGNYSGMVCSFITSAEYQRRFSENVSHSNAECGR